MMWTGTVKSGRGLMGAAPVVEKYGPEVKRIAGFYPYPGTLNLHLDRPLLLPWEGPCGIHVIYVDSIPLAAIHTQTPDRIEVFAPTVTHRGPDHRDFYQDFMGWRADDSQGV